MSMVVQSESLFDPSNVHALGAYKSPSAIIRSSERSYIDHMSFRYRSQNLLLSILDLLASYSQHYQSKSMFIRSVKSVPCRNIFM